MKKNKSLKVSIVMGSQSDYKVMHLAEKILKKIGVPFETKIISAHRTPKRMYDYALEANKNNIGAKKKIPNSLLKNIILIPSIRKDIFSKNIFKLKNLE